MRHLINTHLGLNIAPGIDGAAVRDALAVGAGEPDTDEAAVRDGEAVPGSVLVGDAPMLRLALAVGAGEPDTDGVCVGVRDERYAWYCASFRQVLSLVGEQVCKKFVAFTGH
jgi:hypothetical protein